MGEKVRLLIYFRILQDLEKVHMSIKPVKKSWCQERGREKDSKCHEKIRKIVNEIQNTRDTASVLTPCCFGILIKVDKRWGETSTVGLHT